jgi:DnaK suppressor protein
MDQKTRALLREQLEAERARLADLVAEIEREGHEALSEASGENNYRDHMADQGSATFERELDMTLDDNVRAALTDVEKALARMEAGTYGTCERCGEEISPSRLEAIPTASLCIKCKEAEELR